MSGFLEMPGRQVWRIAAAALCVWALQAGGAAAKECIYADPVNNVVVGGTAKIVTPGLLTPFGDNPIRMDFSGPEGGQQGKGLCGYWVRYSARLLIARSASEFTDFRKLANSDEIALGVEGNLERQTWFKVYFRFDDKDAADAWQPGPLIMKAPYGRDFDELKFTFADADGSANLQITPSLVTYQRPGRPKINVFTLVACQTPCSVNSLNEVAHVEAAKQPLFSWSLYQAKPPQDKMEAKVESAAPSADGGAKPSAAPGPGAARRTAGRNMKEVTLRLFDLKTGAFAPLPGYVATAAATCEQAMDAGPSNMKRLEKIDTPLGRVDIQSSFCLHFQKQGGGDFETCIQAPGALAELPYLPLPHDAILASGRNCPDRPGYKVAVLYKREGQADAAPPAAELNELAGELIIAGEAASFSAQTGEFLVQLKPAQIEAIKSQGATAAEAFFSTKSGVLKPLSVKLEGRVITVTAEPRYVALSQVKFDFYEGDGAAKTTSQSCDLILVAPREMQKNATPGGQVSERYELRYIGRDGYRAHRSEGVWLLHNDRAKAAIVFRDPNADQKKCYFDNTAIESEQLMAQLVDRRIGAPQPAFIAIWSMDGPAAKLEQEQREQAAAFGVKLANDLSRQKPADTPWIFSGFVAAPGASARAVKAARNQALFESGKLDATVTQLASAQPGTALQFLTLGEDIDGVFKQMGINNPKAPAGVLLLTAGNGDCSPELPGIVQRANSWFGASRKMTVVQFAKNEHIEALLKKNYIEDAGAQAPLYSCKHSVQGKLDYYIVAAPDAFDTHQSQLKATRYLSAKAAELFTFNATP